MNILAVDTSGSVGQLFLQTDAGSLNRRWQKANSHSEMITTEFAEILKDSGLALNSLEKIYVINGPGSFIGIRVALNFAKSLAYSFSLPIVPFNSLQAYALSSSASGRVCSLINAQRNSVFYSQFQVGNKEFQIQKHNEIIEVDYLQRTVPDLATICGPDVRSYKEFLPSSATVSEGPMDLKKIVNWNETNALVGPQSWQKIAPVYIRKSAAEEKRGL